MLLQGSGQEVEVVGAEEGATSFRIAMNGKAFKVLSSTLYQDKIGSIVREICTNALDAHTMAGNTDEPFEIHLPDEFEPWFSVKDFGIGLSDEAVKNVYTVLFESTKDQSNETVGAFGLGSKTPFSYTDQFTVTSVYNGHKNIYSAFLTPSGIPSVQLMHSEETTDRNGVEVSLSAKKGDYQAFSKAALEQLKFFKVKPVVNNAPYAFEFPEMFTKNIVASGNGFVVASSGQGKFVVQGQVGYPFDLHKYASASKNTNAIEFANRLRLLFFAIEFPIGSIGVTASREAMEYTDHTVQAIDRRLLEIRQEIADSFKQIQANCANNWEIAQLSNETDLFGDKIAYEKAFLPAFAKPRLHRNVYSFGLDPMKFGVMHYRRYSSKPWSQDSIAAVNGVKIFIAGGKYQRQKITSLRDKYGDFFVVELKDGNTVLDLSHAVGGYSNFSLLEGVPYTPPPRVQSARSKTSCWKYNGYGTIKSWDKETSLPEGENAIYVLVERAEALYNQEYYSSYNKFLALGVFITRPELYAIRQKDEKAFIEDNPGAMQLKDWVAQQIEELKPELNKIQKRQALQHAAKLSLGYNLDMIVKESDSRAAKLMQFTSKIRLDTNKVGRISDLIAPLSESKLVALVKQYKDSCIKASPILAMDPYHLSKTLTPEQFKKYLEVKF